MSTEKGTSDAAKAPEATSGGQGHHSGGVDYSIGNQGAPNEQLIMIHQFSQSGTYTYNTSVSGRKDPVKPENQASLNRGLTQAWQMLANGPQSFAATQSEPK